MAQSKAPKLLRGVAGAKNFQSRRRRQEVRIASLAAKNPNCAAGAKDFGSRSLPARNSQSVRASQIWRHWNAIKSAREAVKSWGRPLRPPSTFAPRRFLPEFSIRQVEASSLSLRSAEVFLSGQSLPLPRDILFRYVAGLAGEARRLRRAMLPHPPKDYICRPPGGWATSGIRTGVKGLMMS